MCGIGGQFAYRQGRVSRDELQAMSNRMALRGPDGAGAWYGEGDGVGLIHRRLAIIDVSERAAQPMMSDDGRLVVTFNGEIYNYVKLRQSLIAKGHRFRTSSDTEVLLHLYAEKGDQMVADLRGMFAFGIWDIDRQRLLLARGPYGIKPLYYSDDGCIFRFSSQVKALMCCSTLSREVDPAGAAGFYLFGSVPEPFTIYRDVSALPAGCTLVVDRRGGGVQRKYFSVAGAFADAELRAGETEMRRQDVSETVAEALRDTVRHHLVADVPVGLFLSAGIDSGALLGLIRDTCTTEIETVTLAFEEFGGKRVDEAPIAQEVARQYEARHTTRVVTRQEFLADLPSILEAMDQPTIDGLNTWFVSKAARELGLKVAISGLGGDELFAGYPSFRDVPRAVAMLGWLTPKGSARSVLARAMEGHVGHRLDSKLAALLSMGGTYPGAYLVRRGVFMPAELTDVLDTETSKEGLARLRPMAHVAARLGDGLATPYATVATLEAALYMRNQLLRDTDWASMAHSLEVRVPLVDAVLLRTLAPSLVAGLHVAGKATLADSPRVTLPDTVTRRAKTGFSTPIADWLKADPRTQAWRRVPQLSAPRCRWARRWAYTVGDQAGMAA